MKKLSYGYLTDCSLTTLEREFPLMFGDNGNLLWPSRPTHFRNSSMNLTERSLVLSWEPPLDSKYIYCTFFCDFRTFSAIIVNIYIMYNVYNHPHTFLIFLMFFSSNSENAYGTENTKKCSKVVYMYMEKMDM